MLTFKQFLLESVSGAVSTKLGTFKIVPDPMYADDTALYNVPVDKIEKSWKQDKDFYIASDKTGEIRGRYDRFIEFLKSSPKEVYASCIYIDDHGDVKFNNGRHRFAVLRDMGVKTIPISISKDAIPDAKKFSYI